MLPPDRRPRGVRSDGVRMSYSPMRLARMAVDLVPAADAAIATATGAPISFMTRLMATENGGDRALAQAFVGDVAEAHAVAAPRHRARDLGSSSSVIDPETSRTLAGQHLGQVLLAVAVDAGECRGFRPARPRTLTARSGHSPASAEVEMSATHRGAAAARDRCAALRAGGWPRPDQRLGRRGGRPRCLPNMRPDAPRR